MPATLCALVLFGFPKVFLPAPQKVEFNGGQFVLIDGPDLRKPLILQSNQTTVRNGQVFTKTFPKVAHLAVTLVISNGENWTVTRTGDGTLFGGFPMTFRYNQPNDHTIKITGDCGVETYKFSFDGKNLVLDNEKTKVREVYRRL